MNRVCKSLVLITALALLMTGAVTAQDDIVIDFYFPSATANDAEGIFQRYADTFEERNEGISINPVFTGSYTDTRNTILTELQGGGRRTRCRGDAVDRSLQFRRRRLYRAGAGIHRRDG